MTDQDSLPQIPDFLASLLGANEDIQDGFSEEESQDRVRLNRVDVPQSTSADTASIGSFVQVSIDPDEELPNVQTMRVLLIDVLNFNTRNRPDSARNIPGFILEDEAYKGVRGMAPPLGGRTMWPYTEDAERDTEAKQPVCRTSNGIAPWKKFVGAEVFDPRGKVKVKIGLRYDKDQPEKSTYACLTCPLGSWFKDVEGKWKAPVCNPTTTYVFYDVDGDRLFTMSGANRGLQIALQGEKKKTDDSPAVWDGTELKGVEYYFLPNDSKNPDRSPSRPEGMPNLQNPQRPVYPVLVYLTLNSFPKKATIIPNFVVMDGATPEVLAYGNPVKGAKTADQRVRTKIEVERKPLTMTELGAWLTARKQYHDEAYREKLMSLDDLQPNVRVMTDDAVAALEGGPSTVTEGIIVDATPPWNAAAIEES